MGGQQAYYNSSLTTFGNVRMGIALEYLRIESNSGLRYDGDVQLGGGIP
jgi:hypothetical protein